MGAARALGVSRMVFGDLFWRTCGAIGARELAPTGIEPVSAVGRRHARAGPRDDRGRPARLRHLLDPPQAAPRAGWAPLRGLPRRLPEGVDPCAERASFTPSPVPGPMFAQPIPVRVGEPSSARASSSPTCCTMSGIVRDRRSVCAYRSSGRSPVWLRDPSNHCEGQSPRGHERRRRSQAIPAGTAPAGASGRALDRPSRRAAEPGARPRFARRPFAYTGTANSPFSSGTGSPCSSRSAITRRARASTLAIALLAALAVDHRPWQIRHSQRSSARLLRVPLRYASRSASQRIHRIPLPGASCASGAAISRRGARRTPACGPGVAGL